MKHKVYIIIQGGYGEGYCVLAVYGSKKSAQKAYKKAKKKAKFECGDLEHVDLEEWDVKK